jgi:hypothetical protein
VIRRLVLLVALQLAAGTATAQLPSDWAWTYQGKVGGFEPDIDRWSEFYGRDYTGQVAGAVGVLPHPRWELGVELGYARDTGQGYLPIADRPGGRVRMEFVPLTAYTAFRADFKPRQAAVPYAGIGVTRMHYRQRIEGQSDVQGAGAGLHLRAGVDILMDRLDPRSARRADASYGLRHTYLTLELQSTDVKVDGTQVGGVSYLLGVRLRF